MTLRLISGLAATLAMLANATGCRRPDARGTAASSASQPGSSAAPQGGVVASPDGERLRIARFLGQGCALDQANMAWCWSAPTGSLGSHEGSAVPERVPELDGALAFQKTTYFSYILRGGNLYVWGKEKHSYLGDVSKPKPMPAPTEVTSLLTYGSSGVALRRNGEMWEWHDWANSEAAGERQVMDNRQPTRLATAVRSLAPPASDSFISTDGKIYRRSFQGDEQRLTQVTELKDPLSVTVCSALSCAVMNPERVECWEESKPSAAFALKAPSAAVSIKCAGGGDILALLANGEIWVLEVSYGVHKFHRVPTVEGVAELGWCEGTLGCPHCLKLKDGTATCWGQGDSRQLGSGTWPTDPQFTPLLKGRDVTTPRSR